MVLPMSPGRTLRPTHPAGVLYDATGAILCIRANLSGLARMQSMATACVVPPYIYLRLSNHFRTHSIYSLPESSCASLVSVRFPV